MNSDPRRRRAAGKLDVSVVIPVYNMSRQLRSTLASLSVQTLPADRYEVIVVDDASSEDVLGESREVMQRLLWCDAIRWPAGSGAAGARNAGAARARGSVLVFLDADCLAHPALLAAHLQAQTERSLAATGYTYARELTPSSWLLRLGGEWDLGDVGEVFRRARADPRLHDFRAEQLAAPRESDWAFFWTQNASIRRDDFERVGGFCEDFPVKGVEDMEIALRLREIGTPTVFLPGAQAFHQPHNRDRHRDLVRDRCNDFLLLRRHPRLEVEVVCSYDIEQARRLWPKIRSFASRLDPASIDCHALSSLPAVVQLLRASRRSAVVGEVAGWPADLPPPAIACHPAAGCGPGTTRPLQLLGTRLPFDDDEFDVIVVTDYWRMLPERTLCRVLDEALRCGQRTVLLSDAATAGNPAPDEALCAALATEDRPFWEFTFSLCRELHQFSFAEIDRAARGPARAMVAERRPWVTEPLARVLDRRASVVRAGVGPSVHGGTVRREASG